MKKRSVIVLVVCLVLMFPVLSWGQSATCNTIKSGLITDTKGVLVQLGYDMWGYNYQAHMFNGLYDNYSRPNPPVADGMDNLIMKWSDEWLSNLDCNSDGKLDRGLDRKTGISDGVSKGWLTNHNEGDYTGDDNELHHYTYFCKIVWVGPPPEGSDPWVDKRIWGIYAIIEEVTNDPYAGLHGVDRSKLVNPAGLGFWTN